MYGLPKNINLDFFLKKTSLQICIGAPYLDDILQNGTITQTTHSVFGDVIKVIMPNGAGAWWKTIGSFIGFLEPN